MKSNKSNFKFSKYQKVGIIVRTKKKTRLFKAFDECFDIMSADYDFCYMFS